MLRVITVAVAAVTIGWMAPMTAARAATVTPPVPRAALVGELGIEGGAYPGGFHPGAGSVEVAFSSVPLTLEQRVGPSGHFRIPLVAGTYTVTGCGPNGPCSSPKTLTLRPGQARHIRLIWELVP